MGKKMFILIVALMSISLIGIITVQLYWINNAVESKNAQFKNDVQKSLGSAVERINFNEEQLIQKKMENVMENIGLANDAQIRNYLFQEIDTTTKQKFTFGATFLEENFKLPTEFLDNDTIIVKRVSGKQDFFHSTLTKGLDNNFMTTDETRVSYIKSFPDISKSYNSNVYGEIFRRQPITARINNNELNSILKEELSKRNVNLDFKYGVYSHDGLATKLKSGYYTINVKESYQIPLFYNTDNEVEYELFITFPGKNNHILSGISNILLLSLFFIFIIIIAFSSSLYQLVRQKKISEIKTDFINNMTHEFKTPIATINLALDSIKNPKIIDDKVKVLRYVGMIREENKRMHAQVENVLRISRLEKNQIEISRDAVDGHDIIEDAITHISLLVKDRGGLITTHFQAISSEILGNQFHLTNVIVNILENALKYSEGKPKIDIYTESTSKFFVIKIKDEGIGMAKSSQKYIFDKFYREQKGNIHNVKGHGLGLAYVKEIIDKHHGTIFVESEKGKGSIFTVRLSLI